MAEQAKLVHRVVDELRELGKVPFVPTADIDIVWVLSAPGTIEEISDDGIYQGESADKVNIQAGIGLVRKITALRLNKELRGVTKEDIKDSGPILFYNGEDKGTKNVKYLQNEALAKATEAPDFPIPKSKIVIGHIDKVGTPAQVEGLANYLATTGFEGKIAAVSMVHHSRRLSRYLRSYKDIFPSKVAFVNAYIPETVNTLGKSLREVRKIVNYSKRGDLAEEPLEGF